MNIKIFTCAVLLVLAGIQSCSSNKPARHRPDPVEAAAVIRDLNAGKNIFIQDKTISGNLDFTTLENKVTEGKGLQRVYVTGAITFINCVFTGKISAHTGENESIILCDFAKNVTFSECQFKDIFTFREAVIHGNCSFNGSFFIGRANFEGVRFLGETGFNKSNFGEELRFQNAIFGFKSNFMDAVFGKTTYFQACRFGADAQLSNARWMGYADFSLCVFSEGAFFNYTRFDDRVVFNNTVFHGRAEFMKAAFTGAGDFRNCRFDGQTRMNDSEVQQAMNFSGSVFLLELPDVSLIHKTGKASVILDQVKSGQLK